MLHPEIHHHILKHWKFQKTNTITFFNKSMFKYLAFTVINVVFYENVLTKELQHALKMSVVSARGKLLIELWVTTFLSDWQSPLIFVRIISNLLCMCSWDSEVNKTKIKGGCQSGRKVVPHDSKSDLPLDRLSSKYILTYSIWSE